MIEKVYNLATGSQKTIEKVIQKDHIHYIHMIFNKDEGLPIHNANSNVFMTVLKGTLTIGLDDQPPQKYKSSTLLEIPFQTKMDVKNRDDEILELIVVKAPAPGKI